MTSEKIISVYDKANNYLGLIAVPIDYKLKHYQQELNNRFPNWYSIRER